MPIPQKKSSLPSFDEIPEVKETGHSIRDTKRWKELYKKNLKSAQAMRGTKQQKEEAYLKMIDKLASQPPVNQKNIMAAFPGFASEDFKYSSDDED